MALFDDWAKFTVRVLQAESDLSGALVAHPVLLGNARETIVRTILARIVPSAYEIGRGLVVDSNGKKSKEMDIVIARRDCPALLLASGDKLYPVEGVLATIEVKSTLTKAELIKALDNCASIADLSPAVDSPSLNALRTKSKIKEAKPRTRDRDTYLERQRFNLRFYPATYVYGFKGYRRNFRELRNVVNQWREREAARRKKRNESMTLCHLPAVLAAEGCFGCRNAIPLFEFIPDLQSLRPYHFYFGEVAQDDTPLRLLISHLLATLYAKIPWPADIEGLRMEPRRHIEQMKLPQGEFSGFWLDSPSPDPSTPDTYPGKQGGA